jgi:hypothetical protein
MRSWRCSEASTVDAVEIEAAEAGDLQRVALGAELAAGKELELQPAAAALLEEVAEMPKGLNRGVIARMGVGAVQGAARRAAAAGQWGGEHCGNAAGQGAAPGPSAGRLRASRARPFNAASHRPTPAYRATLTAVSVKAMWHRMTPVSTPAILLLCR